MKKGALLTVFTILILSVLYVGISASSDMPDVSKVQNVYVYNHENEAVLFSKNENDKIYPASTAKIMTGVLAVEHYNERYGELITVTKESLGSFKGKNLKLQDGEMFTAENLLYAAICGGYNDAANVLAYEIAGSHEAFVQMMNEKAKEIGMTNTNYTNAYGYSDSAMYTTAKDTAILAKYAYFTPGFMEISGEVRYVLPETNMSNVRYIYNSCYLVATNAEKKYRNPDARGMNAGSTAEGGHVCVTAVSKNGMTNFYVLMGGHFDEEEIYSYKAANELIDWSYKNFEYRKIIDSSEMICEIDVALSSQVDYVVLSPEKTIEYFLPTSVDIEKEIKREITLNDDKLNAPIEAGYVAGKIVLTYNGEVISEVNLVTKNNVDRNGVLYILERIKSFTKSSKFKIVLLVAVVVFVLYIMSALGTKKRGNRYKYKYNRYKRR
ncbi:MAG: D-alanyl-D-alanine carboxypeptidase [Clostridia bacterium]|nr:D-alanyl-D-alanine carboxypeptidase [Clostridia bacterium]